MWWRELLTNWRRSARIVVALAAASLTAGCFEPLYKSHPSVDDGVQDKFAAVEIRPITAAKGTPTERVAVALYNALSYNLHNGGNGAPPLYRLKVDVSSSQFTAVINPTSGRPDASKRRAWQRVGAVRRPHRDAARSVADGASPPRRRKISVGTQHCRRPRSAQGLLPPPRKLGQAIPYAVVVLRQIANPDHT